MQCAVLKDEHEQAETKTAVSIFSLKKTKTKYILLKAEI